MFTFEQKNRSLWEFQPAEMSDSFPFRLPVATTSIINQSIRAELNVLLPERQNPGHQKQLKNTKMIYFSVSFFSSFFWNYDRQKEKPEEKNLSMGEFFQPFGMWFLFKSLSNSFSF